MERGVMNFGSDGKVYVNFEDSRVYGDGFLQLLHDFYLEYGKALLRKYSINSESNINDLKTVAYTLSMHAGEFEDVKDMLKEIENDGILRVYHA
jgi:hypothetical protein